METLIRAEEISRVLKDQINHYHKKLEVSETGTVLSVGDGVARVYGLENALAGEYMVSTTLFPESLLSFRARFMGWL